MVVFSQTFFFKGLANEQASIFQTRSEYFENTSSEHNRFWVGVGSRCLLSTRIPTVSKKDSGKFQQPKAAKQFQDRGFLRVCSVG